MTKNWAHLRTALIMALLLPAMAGCLTSGDDPEANNSGGGSGATPPVSPPPPPPPSGNRAPSISGTPPSSITIGQAYTFVPTASDPDGDTLSFSAQNLPSWATFNSITGMVSGTPAQGDEGTYSNIQITVTDGSLSATLGAYQLAVNQAAVGSATLSWDAPTEYTDGSPLSAELAGYRIYYGLSQGNYPNRIEVNNPGVTSYVVENLSPNTYFFVSTAVDTSGIESGFSNVASATITAN